MTTTVTVATAREASIQAADGVATTEWPIARLAKHQRHILTRLVGESRQAEAAELDAPRARATIAGVGHLELQGLDARYRKQTGGHRQDARGVDPLESHVAGGRVEQYSLGPGARLMTHADGRTAAVVGSAAEDTPRGLMQDYPLTLHHIFWRIERLFANKEVVTKREAHVHRYTYGDLARRVYRLANALQRVGVRPGDRVATLAWNNYRHLELYYAIPLLGAVLHTLNLRLFADQLEFVIRDASDRFIFVDASLIPLLDKLTGKLDTVQRIVVLADEGEQIPEHRLGALADYEQLLAAEDERFVWPAVDERAAAAMCYTSGTTGNPKGVVYTHRSQFLHAMGTLQVGSMAISEADVILPAVPMFHANCWGLPYTAGLAGAKLIMLDRWVGDGNAFVDLAEAEGATVLGGVPTIGMNLLKTLRQTGRRLPKVRQMLCGGSAVPEALMRGLDELGIPILHAWGMTETSPVATVARPRTRYSTEAEQFRCRLTQGIVQPGVELRIADLSTGEELPWDGQVFGEVQVRGPWIASGYHNDADPERMTADGWLRTGDVATVSPDGYVTLVDRVKDVIKSGGEWVSSVDLENAIMGHPQVAEAAVIGLPHPIWQERPVAYVVPRPEYRDQLRGADILDFLSTRVAKWWLPDEVRLVGEVPKTSVGKFDKKALRVSAAPLAATGSGSLT